MRKFNLVQTAICMVAILCMATTLQLKAAIKSDHQGFNPDPSVCR